MIGLLRRVRPHLDVAGEIAAYAVWLLVDVAVASSSSAAPLAPVSGALVATIVLLRRRPGARLRTVAATAVGTSLLLSAVSWTGVLGRAGSAAPRAYDFSFTEQLALAVLVIAALRRYALKPALAVTLAAGVAIIVSPLVRLAATGEAPLAFVSALGWGGAVIAGLVVREVEHRRRVALDAVRTAERMELARELHDVVAHHVTGIVVAAQAAAVVARTSPDDVERALGAIERAGGDALAAMRRTVGVLRGDEGARTPGARLGDVTALVDRFDPDGSLVRLSTDPGLEHAVLPAGLAATGYRVVQEALTNVRRHAPEARAVEVDLRVRDEALHVCVRNDGVGPRARGGGGFGLVGMGERVAALDGELTAGPTDAGVWTVAARLPLRAGR